MHDEVIPTDKEVRSLAGQGPGSMIRRARETLGMSQQQLAAQLKLSERVVVALEADDLDTLPSAVFVRGYLGSFARMLELDVNELNQAFDCLVAEQTVEEEGVSTVVMQQQSQKRSDQLVRRWGTTAIVLVLVALSLIWWQGEIALRLWGESDQSVQNIESNLTVGEGALALPEPPEGEPRESSEEVGNSPATMGAQPEMSPQPQISRVEPESIPAPITEETQAESVVSAIAPEPVAAPVNLGEDRLVLTATAESWAEVTDAQGIKLVYDLLQSGSMRAIRGAAPFQVYLGYAPGVEVELNGEEVDKGRVYASGIARFQAVTVKAN